MKRYIGTKLINAVPMDRLSYNQLRGWDLPKDENGSDEGYLIEVIGGNKNLEGYDGYVQWLPTKSFNFEFQPIDNMTFGIAIEALKQDKKVARAGWNGKGMFVYLVPSDEFPAKTQAAKSFFGDDGLVPYNAYMAIKNVNDTVSTWVPSVNDCLAEDWQIVD